VGSTMNVSPRARLSSGGSCLQSTTPHGKGTPSIFSPSTLAGVYSTDARPVSTELLSSRGRASSDGSRQMKRLAASEEPITRPTPIRPGMFEAEYLEPAELLPALPVAVKGALDIKSPTSAWQSASPNAALRKALSGSFADYFSRRVSPVVTPDPTLNKALSGSFAAYLDSNVPESGHLASRLTKALSGSFAAHLDLARPEPIASDLGTMFLNSAHVYGDRQRSDTPRPMAAYCAGAAADLSSRYRALLQKIEEAERELPQLVTVLRDGELKAVEACDLVPGDVVQL